MSSGIVVRVGVLTDVAHRQCDLCLGVGRHAFNAAYRVLDVWVCRRHIAKVIDSASRRLFSTVNGTARNAPVYDSVTSLSQARGKRGGLVRPGAQQLEKIGIFDIPDEPE